jgi:hypothetical protein
VRHSTLRPLLLRCRGPASTTIAAVCCSARHPLHQPPKAQTRTLPRRQQPHVLWARSRPVLVLAPQLLYVLLYAASRNEVHFTNGTRGRIHTWCSFLCTDAHVAAAQKSLRVRHQEHRTSSFNPQRMNQKRNDSTWLDGFHFHRILRCIFGNRKGIVITFI